MRFGLFIPQGWRMDLVGIEPEKHWAVMRDLAAYADISDHASCVASPDGNGTVWKWS